MLDYYSNDRFEMQGLLPPGSLGRVLEVGCGSGIFISSLNAKERWGVEPFDVALRAAESRGVKCLGGRFSDVEAELPDAYFDVVVANDVVEHMPDHEEFLKSIQRKIATGGHLIISVPNVRHLATLLRLVILKDWRYESEGVLDRTHLRFFTRRSIQRSLSVCGYQIEEIRGLRSIFRIDRGVSLPKTFLNWLVGSITIGASLGHAWDTQYLQFGIRARIR